MLADAGCDVTLYARRPELAKAITEDGENRDYLPGIRLPHAVRATADPAEALIDASIVVLAVPSQSLGTTSPAGRRCSRRTRRCCR